MLSHGFGISLESIRGRRLAGVRSGCREKLSSMKLAAATASLLLSPCLVARVRSDVGLTAD